MSFPRYPEYKDSGVDWLGEVPRHWKVHRLKRLARLLTEKADRREFPVALENIESWTGNYIATDSDFYGEGVAFAPGDVLFGKLRPYLAKALVSTREGEAIGDFHVLRPTGVLPAYLHRLLLTQEVISLVDGSTYGAKMPRASWEFMSTLELPAPSPAEQSAIATFVDREAAKIDALIVEQERLIDVLKEKRQAVITHAVTKGLDANLPMKDSGIEWLGEVPVHWTMKRLKHVATDLTVGIVVNPSNYVSDEGLPFIYGGDIVEGEVKYQGARHISPEHSLQNSKTMLREGDVLTVRVGAPGITAVVPKECDGGNCASVMLIRRGNFNSQWLSYAMNSRMVRYQVEVVQYGAAQEQFNISHAVDFWIPTPPRREQDAIARHLDAITSKVDGLISAAHRSIELLKERRSTLISAAVTGKIDVRGLVQDAQPSELESA